MKPALLGPSRTGPPHPAATTGQGAPDPHAPAAPHALPMCLEAWVWVLPPQLRSARRVLPHPAPPHLLPEGASLFPFPDLVPHHSEGEPPRLPATKGNNHCHLRLVRIFGRFLLKRGETVPAFSGLAPTQRGHSETRPCRCLCHSPADGQRGAVTNRTVQSSCVDICFHFSCRNRRSGVAGSAVGVCLHV